MCINMVVYRENFLNLKLYYRDLNYADVIEQENYEVRSLT